MAFVIDSWEVCKEFRGISYFQSDNNTLEAFLEASVIYKMTLEATGIYNELLRGLQGI